MGTRAREVLLSPKTSRATERASTTECRIEDDVDGDIIKVCSYNDLAEDGASVSPKTREATQSLCWRFAAAGANVSPKTREATQCVAGVKIPTRRGLDTSLGRASPGASFQKNT